MRASVIFQVVSIQQYAVKPRTADINENILSEQCLAETSLTEAAVKAAEPLETVLAKVSGALELSSGRRRVRPSPAYLHSHTHTCQVKMASRLKLHKLTLATLISRAHSRGIFFSSPGKLRFRPFA